MNNDNYYNSHLLMLLFLLFPLLDHAYAQQFDLGEGDRCRVSQGDGICLLINRCQSVYNELVAGKRPEVTCGFRNNIPIVCCPLSNTGGTNNNGQPTGGGSTPNNGNPFVNSRPARRMCAVYAKSVFAMQRSPVVLGGSAQYINVSLCALTSRKLIVGGTKAEPMEFPHMAAIGYNTDSRIRWDCGGTLVSELYVLTAAHCLNSLQWGLAQWVRVGDLNLQNTNDNAQPQDRRIVQRIAHPNYRRPPQYNDIGLVRLQQAVVFTAYVRPACLDYRGFHPVGERAVAAGWGVVDWFDDSGSPDLLKVTLPIVNYNTCQRYYNEDTNRLPNGIDDPTQMCAGENGKDTCQGDSGGPLMIYSNDEYCMYDVIGVTSFGQLCGSVSPGIYSRVYTYLPWIESVVWPNLG